MRKVIALLFAGAIASPAFAATMIVGTKPVAVTIKGDDGGKLDGTPWSSDMIKGKVWVLFYVDPDRRNANEDLESALEKEQFPREKYGSIGMINMAATWLPNAAIASSLADKQKRFPEPVYVKDINKVLVDKWHMTDDDYDVVVFDKQGLVVYAKDGEFTKSDIAAMIAVIKANLDKP